MDILPISKEEETIDLPRCQIEALTAVWELQG